MNKEHNDSSISLLVLGSGQDLSILEWTGIWPPLILRADQVKIDQIFFYNSETRVIDTVAFLDHRHPFLRRPMQCGCEQCELMIESIEGLIEPIRLSADFFDAIDLMPTGGMTPNVEAISIDADRFLSLAASDPEELEQWLASEVLDQMILNRRSCCNLEPISREVWGHVPVPRLKQLPNQWLLQVKPDEHAGLLYLLNSAFDTRATRLQLNKRARW